MIIILILKKKASIVEIIDEGITPIIIVICLTIVSTAIMLNIIRFKGKILIGFYGIKPVYIDLSGNRHVIIFGMTGSGKTETAKKIIGKTKRSKLILDWSGEYSDYKSVEPRELQIDLKRDDIIDAIISTFQLTLPQQTLLIEASKRSGKLNEIIEEVKRINYQSDSGREVRDALIRKLTILEKLNIFTGEKKLKDVEAINLSKMAFEAKKLAVNIILKSFYNNPEERILVIEEAQNIMPRTQNIDTINTAELIINELRKHGVNVILIAQTPSQISTVYRNAEYIIIHRLRLTFHEAQELGLKNEEIEEISKLNVGECIIIGEGKKRRVKINIKSGKPLRNEYSNMDENDDETKGNCKILEKRIIEEKGVEKIGEVERRILSLEQELKQLTEKFIEVRKVKIAENPIALGEFIDRVEEKIMKISASINIMKDKITLIENEINKSIMERQRVDSLINKVDKIEKQTSINVNRIIELEKKLMDITVKMGRFEEWVKEALTRIEEGI
ncbi:MAG: DUF87 domain-containing protein [Candidatus Methanomethylicia archaeon]